MISLREITGVLLVTLEIKLYVQLLAFVGSDGAIISKGLRVGAIRGIWLSWSGIHKGPSGDPTCTTCLQLRVYRVFLVQMVPQEAEV